jgi:hypothetical protein
VVFAALGSACSDEQKKDLGEIDVRESLDQKTQDAVDDAGENVDGDLECTADLDTEPNVTASCTGTTENGQAVASTYSGGTADIGDAKCRAALTVEIAGKAVKDEPEADCFDL